MLTFFEEKTPSVMGNGQNSGEKKSDAENEDDFTTNLRNSANGLIFFAGTDKARVITEILEERGWCRTKDHNVTNFTIKWCLAHQVDWNQFQEGKQLINNIPGQLAFADKINLWYTIRDYLRNRRTIEGNRLQTFLPMTFVLDEEDEVTDFLRAYKKQNRAWICKPRYSYAGRGIYVLSGNSDLNTIFKFKVGTGNRLQYEPRLRGYLMQEYISRPLLIKSRKFDIRVHWLVAWTKPLLAFYNHNASVVRLSLNLYREFDFDRATHLTNLSVQENHCRYPFAQESTGMTMNQLNHYFNQCFRPFHPRMCQDWVMTVMQERMQTIIRHVIRASKNKLTRGAGQFGFFGCDFLLDENFRIWLLEVNDNPGVGWGNPRVNTTTKPLFEETLNIVFECFDKYKKGQSLLPIECLQNYQLIYNEDDDNDRRIHDDNQIFTEPLSMRYAKKESSSRTSFRRILPQANSSRISIHQNDNNTDNSTTNSSDIVLPLVNMTNSSSSIVDIIPPSPSIIDNTPVNLSGIFTMSLSPPIIDKTPVNLSRIRATPINPPVIDKTLVNPSRSRATPVHPPIIDKTLVNPSRIHATPVHPPIINKIPVKPSRIRTTSVSPPIIVKTPADPSRIRTTSVSPPIINKICVKPSRIRTTSVSPPIIVKTPANPSRIRTKSVSPPIIAKTPANPSRIRTTSVNPPIIDKTPVKPSRIRTTSVNLSVADAKPSNPPIIRITPVNSPIISTTPVNLSVDDAKPINPTLFSITSSSLSTVTTSPLSSMTLSTTYNRTETIESFKHGDDIKLARVIKPTKSLLISSLLTRQSSIKTNKIGVRRTLSNTTSLGMQRKNRIDVTSILINDRHYTNRHAIIPACTKTIKTKDKTNLKEEKRVNISIMTLPTNI